MAKISELPPIGAIDGLEVVPVLSAGVARRASLGQIAGLVLDKTGGQISGGNVLASARRLPQAFNGAIPILDASGVCGFTVPAGKTGKDSLDQLETPIPGDLLAGATIRVVLTVDLSDPFTRDVRLNGVSFRPDVGAAAARTYTPVPIVSPPGQKRWALDVRIEAQDRFMAPFFQLASAVAAAVEESVRASDLRWSVVADAPRAANDMNVERRAGAMIDAAALANIAEPQDVSLHVENGAVAISRGDGVGIGWSMDTAPNRSGYNSNLIIREDLNPALAGATELFEIVAAVSTPFTRNLAREIVIDQVGGGNDDATVFVQRFAIFGGFLRWTFQRKLRPGNARLTAILRVTADGSPATPEFLKLVSVKRRYLTSTDPLRNTGELTAERDRQRMLASAARNAVDGIVPREVIVRADGSGDYPTVEAAMNAITTASAINPYAIRVLPGRHIGLSGLMSTKDHVDIVGTNRRTSILYYASPVDASAGQLAQSYVSYTNSRSLIYGVRAIVERARYGFHPDGNNLINKDSVTRFKNCFVAHLGNASATNAASALGGVAIGAGVDSGSKLIIEECELSGPWGGGLAAHNNIDSQRPALLVCRNSRSLAHEAGKYASMQSLGSGQADLAIFETNVIPGGRFVINNALWLTQRYSPANRTEWTIYGSGNTPAAAYVVDPARALRITSADATAATLVEIVEGGSALPLIFGQVLNSAGGVGRPADAYGTVDVSGSTNGMTLGHWLGNCQSVPKSFQVRFEGGAAVTVAFTTDLRDATNNQVLALINAVLGSRGRADLWAVAVETERPFFLDEEYAPINSTGSAILRGTACAFDGDVGQVRKMTAADPARLFAGFAYQDMLAGRAGRVKGSPRAVKAAGFIALNDVLVDGVGMLGETLAFGDVLGIGDTPGRLVKNAATALVSVVKPIDVPGGFTPALSLRL